MTTAQAFAAVRVPSVEPGSAGTGSRRRLTDRLTARAHGLSAVDGLLTLGVLGAVLLVSEVDAVGGIQGVLAAHVTVTSLLLVSAAVLAWSLVLRLFGVDVASLRRRRRLPAWRIAAAAGVCAVIASTLPWIGGGGWAVDRFAAVWAGGSLVLVAIHAGAQAWMRRRRRGSRRRVLIVGTGPLAQSVVARLAADADVSFEIVGFVDSARALPAAPEMATRTLGALETLQAILMRDHVDEVFVALPVKSHYREIQDVLTTCEQIGVRSKYRADLFQTDVAWPRYEAGGDQIVTLQVTDEGSHATVKRVFDIVAAAILLAALSPVIAGIAAAIGLASRGPVLFVQERCGLNRRRFRMLKFRTMVADAESLQASLEGLNETDGAAFKMARDPRVTPLGRLLRRTSLDELPQLINVLRGDMSLVGPRPLPLRDVARFTAPGDMRRFSVRPGLTCLWQVSGRSNLSFREWMQLDLLYIDGWSLGLDLLILARTVPAVFRGTGAH